MGEVEEQSAWGFETRAVHTGQEPDPVTGAVVTPISLSTTFAQDGVGGHKGFEYSRSGNPTRAALETCVASLEGALMLSRLYNDPAYTDRVVDHLVAHVETLRATPEEAA